jgi:hypothetical protein
MNVLMSIGYMDSMTSARGDIPQKFGKILQTFLIIYRLQQLSIIEYFAPMEVLVLKFQKCSKFVILLAPHKFLKMVLYVTYYGQTPKKICKDGM